MCAVHWVPDDTRKQFCLDILQNIYCQYGSVFVSMLLYASVCACVRAFMGLSVVTRSLFRLPALFSCHVQLNLTLSRKRTRRLSGVQQDNRRPQAAQICEMAKWRCLIGGDQEVPNADRSAIGHKA